MRRPRGDGRVRARLSRSGRADADVAVVRRDLTLIRGAGKEPAERDSLYRRSERSRATCPSPRLFPVRAEALHHRVTLSDRASHPGGGEAQTTGSNGCGWCRMIDTLKSVPNTSLPLKGSASLGHAAACGHDEDRTHRLHQLRPVYGAIDRGVVVLPPGGELVTARPPS